MCKQGRLQSPWKWVMAQWTLRSLVQVFNRNLLHSPLNELFYSAGLSKCYEVHDEQRTHPVSHPDQSPPFSLCRTLSVSLSNPGQQFHMYNHLCNPIKRPGKLLNYIANDFLLICVHQSRCSRRWAAPCLQLHGTHIHCKVLVACIFLCCFPHHHHHFRGCQPNKLCTYDFLWGSAKFKQV